jgi:membrane-associated protease RseP (regulator of RpoE activity)
VKDLYAIPIATIEEILPALPIEAVPQCPDFVRGVIFLRGHLIPVLSASERLGFPSQQYLEEPTIVCLRIEIGRATDSAGSWRMFGPDSTFVRGFDMLTTTATLGMRAVAGAELAPLNPGLSEYFGTTEGVLVLNAREGTPAARSGLRAGDVIVRVGDTAVRSISELRRAVDRAPAGAVTLGVLRRGQSVTVTLDR